jgi:hypothetical protein
LSRHFSAITEFIEHINPGGTNAGTHRRQYGGDHSARDESGNGTIQTYARLIRCHALTFRLYTSTLH